MKTIAVILMCLALAGCSTLDALFPDPVPVCDKDSVGVKVKDMGECVKYSDGTFRWVNNP